MAVCTRFAMSVLLVMAVMVTGDIGLLWGSKSMDDFLTEIKNHDWTDLTKQIAQASYAEQKTLNLASRQMAVEASEYCADNPQYGPCDMVDFVIFTNFAVNSFFQVFSPDKSDKAAWKEDTQNNLVLLDQDFGTMLSAVLTIHKGLNNIKNHDPDPTAQKTKNDFLQVTFAINKYLGGDQSFTSQLTMLHDDLLRGGSDLGDQSSVNLEKVCVSNMEPLRLSAHDLCEDLKVCTQADISASGGSACQIDTLVKGQPTLLDDISEIGVLLSTVNCLEVTRKRQQSFVPCQLSLRVEAMRAYIFPSKINIHEAQSKFEGDWDTVLACPDPSLGACKDANLRVLGHIGQSTKQFFECYWAQTKLSWVKCEAEALLKLDHNSDGRIVFWGVKPDLSGFQWTRLAEEGYDGEVTLTSPYYGGLNCKICGTALCTDLQTNCNVWWKGSYITDDFSVELMAVPPGAPTSLSVLPSLHSKSGKNKYTFPQSPFLGERLPTVDTKRADAPVTVAEVPAIPGSSKLLGNFSQQLDVIEQQLVNNFSSGAHQASHIEHSVEFQKALIMVLVPSILGLVQAAACLPKKCRFLCGGFLFSFPDFLSILLWLLVRKVGQARATAWAKVTGRGSLRDPLLQQQHGETVAAEGETVATEGGNATQPMQNGASHLQFDTEGCQQQEEVWSCQMWCQKQSKLLGMDRVFRVSGMIWGVGLTLVSWMLYVEHSGVGDRLYNNQEISVLDNLIGGLQGQVQNLILCSGDFTCPHESVVSNEEGFAQAVMDLLQQCVNFIEK